MPFGQIIYINVTKLGAWFRICIPQQIPLGVPSSRGPFEDSSTNSSLDSSEYSSTNCSMNSFADSSADSTLL